MSQTETRPSRLQSYAESAVVTWHLCARLLVAINSIFASCCALLIGFVAVFWVVLRSYTPVLLIAYDWFIVLLRSLIIWLLALVRFLLTRVIATLVSQLLPNFYRALNVFFTRLTRLRRWCMSENALRAVPADIAHLRELCELDMSKNFIQHVHANIRYCTLLQKLDLSVNPIGRLPEQVCELRRLTHLKLNEVELVELPSHIGDIRNLVVLELRENRLQRLPDSICLLSCLESLDVGANQLRVLPQRIGALSSLVELFIDSNCLSVLPDSIGVLSTLQQLDASNNELRTLPTSIEYLLNLVELNVADNRLAELPPSIGALRHLAVLKAERNRLVTLPPEIGSCFALRELTLSENRLTELPETVRGWSMLADLNIDRNRLRFLPDAICECIRLELLSAAENELDALPLDLGLLSRLHVLNLAGNRLRWLPVSIEGLLELKACWLSERQVAPLVTFHREARDDIGEVLVCSLLPQLPKSASYNEATDFNPTSHVNAQSGDESDSVVVRKRAPLSASAGGKKKSLRFEQQPPQIVRERQHQHRSLNRLNSPHPSQLRDQQLLLMRAHAHSARKAHNAASRLPSDSEQPGSSSQSQSTERLNRRPATEVDAGRPTSTVISHHSEARKPAPAAAGRVRNPVRSLSFDSALSALAWLVGREDARHEREVDLDVSIARNRSSSSAPNLPRATASASATAAASASDPKASETFDYNANVNVNVKRSIESQSHCRRVTAGHEMADDVKGSEVDMASTRVDGRNNGHNSHNDAIIDSATISSFSTDRDNDEGHSQRRRRVGFADADTEELDTDAKSRLRRRDTPHHTKHCRITSQLPASETDKVREVVARVLEADPSDAPMAASSSLTASKLPATCPLSVDVGVEVEDAIVKAFDCRLQDDEHLQSPVKTVSHVSIEDRERRRPHESSSSGKKTRASESYGRPSKAEKEKEKEKLKEKEKEKKVKHKEKRSKSKSKAASGLNSPTRHSAPITLLSQSNSLQSLSLSSASQTLNRLADGACEFLTLEVHRPADGGLGISIQGGRSSNPSASQQSGRLDTGIYVHVVQPRSAGDRAGLRVGDKLLSVNDTPLANLSHQQTAALLKSAGPVVSLLIARARSTPLPFGDVPLAAAAADSLFLNQQMSQSVSAIGRRSVPVSNARSNSHSRVDASASSRVVRAVSISANGDGALGAPSTRLNNASGFTPNSDSGVPPSGAASLCSTECPLGNDDAEIITGTIQRDESGGLGLSVITGDERLARDHGLINGAIYISKIAKDGATDKCRRFRLGDRIISINQVDVTRLSRDQTFSLLTGLESIVRLSVSRSRAPFPRAALEPQIVPANRPDAVDAKRFSTMPSRVAALADGASAVVRSPSSVFKPIGPRASESQRQSTAAIQMSGDSRREHVLFNKTPNAPIGISIIGGSDKTCQPFGPPYSGVYVSRIARDSPAVATSLRIGDLLLGVNETDLRGLTHEQAKLLLRSLHPTSEVRLLVEHRPLPAGYRELVIVKSSPSELLGMSIKGGGGEHGVNPLDPDDEGIFVWRVHPDGAVHRDGRLTIGVRLLEVNGESLIGAHHGDAVCVLKTATSPIRLLVCDGIDPSALVDDDADDNILPTSISSSVISSFQPARPNTNPIASVASPHSPSSLSSVSIEVANYSLANANASASANANANASGSGSGNRSGSVSTNAVESTIRSLPPVRKFQLNNNEQSAVSVLQPGLQLSHNALVALSGSDGLQWQPLVVLMPMGGANAQGSGQQAIAVPISNLAHSYQPSNPLSPANSIDYPNVNVDGVVAALRAACSSTNSVLQTDRSESSPVNSTGNGNTATQEGRHSSASSTSSVLRRRSQQVVTEALIHHEASGDGKSPRLTRRTADEALELVRQQQASRSNSQQASRSNSQQAVAIANGRVGKDSMQHAQFANVRLAGASPDTFTSASGSSTASTVAGAITNRSHANAPSAVTIEN